MSKINISEVETDVALSVLVHDDDVEIVNDDPNTDKISAVETLAMADKFTWRTWDLAKKDEDFKRRLGIVFPHIDIVTDEQQTLAEYPVAIRHIVGLIICTNKAINTGRRPWWVNPEAYMHPRSQSNLADLARSYIQRAAPEEEIHEAE